jgi:hypothetical protein
MVLRNEVLNRLQGDAFLNSALLADRSSGGYSPQASTAS